MPMSSFSRAAVTGVQKMVPLLKLFDSPADNTAAFSQSSEAAANTAASAAAVSQLLLPGCLADPCEQVQGLVK